MSKERIVALDGLRGAAILMVMVSHLMILDQYNGNVVWTFFKAGWMGVDLFFVLSGFLITDILLKTRNGEHYFRNFIARRTLRIFPLYYAVLIIVWVCGKIFSPEATGDSIAWYFTYSSNVGMAIKNNWLHIAGPLEVSHFWSLAVEEQFYLFWPLVVYFTEARKLIWLCVLMFLAGPFIRMVIGIPFESESLAAYVMTPARMDSLAVGALLSCIRHVDPASTNPRVILNRVLSIGGAIISALALFFVSSQLMWVGLSLMLISVAIDLHAKQSKLLLFAFSGIATIGTLYHYSAEYTYSFFGLFFMMCVNYVVFHRVELANRLFSSRLMIELGTYSYSMYIFHHLFQRQWKSLFESVFFSGKMHELIGQACYIVVCILITYALARISWVILERPFLKLKDRFEY